MSKEWTRDEIREQFLRHIRIMSKYWAECDISRPEFQESMKRNGGEIPYRLNGLCHSILAMLDGCTVDIPGFLLIPNPHPSDKEYCISRGQNYYPQVSEEAGDFVDIGGALHEQFYE
jgi:hypothetical protein